MATHKRCRDSRGHLDPYFQRRIRYAAVLKPLGLDELFAQMPVQFQKLFYRFKSPDPALEFDHTIDVNSKDRTLAKAVTAGFRNSALEINGTTIPVRDFFSILLGCSDIVTYIEGEKMPPAVRRFVDEALPRLRQCDAEHRAAALGAIYLGVHKPLIAQSRLDGRLFSGRLDGRPGKKGTIGAVVTVSAAEAQVRNIRLDGKPRPMYRAAEIGGEGVKWLSWTGEQLGRGDPGAEHPIYVQSHALRQLRARVNLPAAAPYLEAWLADSLAKPRIVERQGPNLLVEYRIHEHRLGYLIATPLSNESGPGGLVVVRTFKFLTMEHSPESRLLHKKLRLTRRDVDWLGLHDLAAFTRTDLRDDPVLRPLLEACGCGHLFAMEDHDYAPQSKPLAGEVRRYLRLAA
jgi:hypothetical protein